MPEDPPPPRKSYGFKEPDFDSINPQRPPAQKTRTTRTPKLIPDQTKPIDVRDIYRQANQTSVPIPPSRNTPIPGKLNATPANPTVPAPREGEKIEVKKLLLRNLEAEKERATEQLITQSNRRSKRTRDYLVCLAIGNLVGLVAIVIVPVLGIAALVLYNVCLAWILFGVLDDY